MCVGGGGGLGGGGGEGGQQMIGKLPNQVEKMLVSDPGKKQTLQGHKRRIYFMKAHTELKRESGTRKVIMTMAATILVVLMVLVMMKVIMMMISNKGS